MKKRVLIASDVDGNFDSVLKKASGIDLVFCVGKTLSFNQQTTDLLSGKTSLAIPFYFIDNGPLKHVLSIKWPRGGELCKNLHYLGNFGQKRVQGFEVAYLSGDYDASRDRPLPSDQQEVVELFSAFSATTVDPLLQLWKTDSEFVGVDFLLTCHWPRQYSKFAGSGEQEHNGIDLVSKLAYVTRPRYHFCGGNDVYYERLPYLNYNFRQQAIHVTRMIGLAKCPEEGGKARFKYLYALVTQPLKDMSQDMINDRPELTTENPYFSYFLESKRNELYTGGYEKSKESTHDIFNNEDRVLTEEEVNKIKEMKENATLYASGFALYTIDNAAIPLLTRSRSSYVAWASTVLSTWSMVEGRPTSTKASGLSSSTASRKPNGPCSKPASTRWKGRLSASS